MKIKHFVSAIGAAAVIAGLAIALSLQMGGDRSTELVSTVLPSDAVSFETAKAGVSGNPSSEIGVFGNWTIDVYNEDGSLASHTTFKNALTNTAPRQIGQLFGHTLTPGIWRISLGTGSILGTGPCGSFVGAPLSCITAEPTDASAGNTNVFNNLTVVPPDDDSEPILALRLDGNITVGVDSSISKVSTFIRYCDSSVSTDQCVRDGNGRARSFGSTDIDRIAVTRGQIVQVKVQYSFATGQ